MQKLKNLGAATVALATTATVASAQEAGGPDISSIETTIAGGAAAIITIGLAVAAAKWGGKILSWVTPSR